MDRIRRMDFGQPLSDGDLIRLEETQIDAGFVEFVLKTASGVTWYKEIKFVDEQGRDRGLVSTQDDNHGPTQPMRFPSTDEIGGAHLQFVKAKILGVHTGVHELCLASYVNAGTRLTFTWERDG